MFSGLVQVSNQQLNTQSVYKDGMTLGTLGVSRAGDIYRFSQAGASNLAAGKVAVTPAKVSNHTNLALASTSNVAVSSTKITVTLGGTAATQDQYLDGYLEINDGTGVGQSPILIAGNTAQTSTTGTVDIYLATGLVIALSTSDTKASLVPNPWSASIVHPGSASAYFCNGVPQVAVTAAYYYWSKTRGQASVLSDGIIAKGAGAQLTTNAVAGALLTEGTSTVVQRVATAPEATVDAKYYPLFMMVD